VSREKTLVFGCSDPDLGYDAWQDVFARLATHLQETVGTDLYGDDWIEADEGCQITASAKRIAEIETAIKAFDGPVETFLE
jgi:hypothetical protein